MLLTPAWLRAIVAAALVAFAAPGFAAAEPPTDAAPTPTGDAPTPTGDAPTDTLTSAERLERSIRVLQRRPVVKDKRLELTFSGGVAASDTMYRHGLLGVTGRFHISEWVSAAVTYDHYFSARSALFNEVTEDFELFPERSELRWYLGGEMSVVPIDGKLVLFDDAIIYFDIFASIGGGATLTSRADSPNPTGMIGVGARFFVTDWLTVTFELRDHIYFESFNAGTELINNVIGRAGLSVFIPFGFDYAYPR